MVELIPYNDDEIQKWAADLDEKVHFPEGERWEIFMKYIDEAEETYFKLFGRELLEAIYREADFFYKDDLLVPPYYDRKNKSLIFKRSKYG